MFERTCRISDPNDKQHWKTMTEIKSNILQRMNAAPPGVRICCVKFVQQVVLAQTPGMIDPRVTMPCPGAAFSKLTLFSDPITATSRLPSCLAIIPY